MLCRDKITFEVTCIKQKEMRRHPGAYYRNTTGMKNTYDLPTDVSDQHSNPGSDGLLRRVAGTGPASRGNLASREEPELDIRARKVCDKFSENLHIIANEPSLAFYRIEEHVRKSLPQLVDQKHTVSSLQQKVQGACFDAEYAKNAVNAMQSSSVHFQNIQDLLKNAMFMKQQIEYEENRKLTTENLESPESQAPKEQTIASE